MHNRTYQSNQQNFSLMEVPEQPVSFKYKEFFDTHEPFSTTSEDLLDWLAHKHPHAKYHDYLDLRKQTIEQGYKTAFDLPLLETEFNFRSILKQFLQWNIKNESTCVDADTLLNWLFKHHDGEMPTYDEFLSLLQAGTAQGLATAIDVPISAAEYNRVYLNSEKSHFRMMSEIIERRYYEETRNPNERRIALVRLIKRVANEDSLQYLPVNQVNDINSGVIIFCKCLIEDEYHFASPKRSFLYDVIQSGMRMDDNDKKDDLRYLVSFKNFIKYASDNFANGLLWKSREDLLSNIDSIIRKYVINRDERLDTVRPSLFANLSFFHKKDKNENVVNQKQISEADEYPMSLSIR